MEKKIKDDTTLSYISLYDKEDKLGYILTCIENKQVISTSGILYLNDVIKNNYSQEIYRDFVIKLYGYSYNFDRANWSFNFIIKPLIDGLTSDNLRTLLEYMNENSQIYDSYAFQDACRMIKERLDVIDSKFNFTPYDKCAPYLK